MTDIPDRLCAEEASPYYDRALLERIVVFVDGVLCDKTVVEYCLSGKWVRMLTKLPDGSFQRNMLGTGYRISRMSNRHIRVELK